MIFIVGNSRSGTTMLGRVMGRHSAVHTFPELQVFERLIQPEQMGQDTPLPEAELIRIGTHMLATMRDGIFKEGPPERFADDIRALIAGKRIQTAMALYAALMAQETQAAGKTRPCEQTPRYLFVTEEILQAFPEARVIHIYRDPRDVLLSQKNRWRRRFLTDKDVPLKNTLVAWSNYHPLLTSMLWGAAMRKADALAGTPRFLEIRYETLLCDPEPVLQKVCAHVGLPFEPEMMQIRREGSSAQRDEGQGHATGFDASRIGSWQSGGLSKAEIAICEARLGAIMAQRGYTPSGERGGLPKRLALQALLPVKILAGLVMNASRFGNLRKTVMRRLSSAPANR